MPDNLIDFPCSPDWYSFYAARGSLPSNPPGYPPARSGPLADYDPLKADIGETSPTFAELHKLWPGGHTPWAKRRR